MRAAIVLALVAACSPDILSGTYLCGPEQSCPEGQACNGSDNRCVLASTVTPFACLPSEEHEPDDLPAMGTPIGALACVSKLFSETGCLAPGDNGDWFTFTAPAGCTALAVSIRVGFPIAYESLGIVLADPSGNPLATEGPCKTSSGNDADDERCIDQTITPGASYAIEIRPAGTGTCNGACNYNRYTLAVQLGTP